MDSSGSDVVIDLEWTNSLKKKIDDASLPKHRRADPPTIFRVPPNMRAADPEAFKPKIIALGPYHRHDPALRSMENLKLRYLQKLLSRNQEVRFEDVAKLIKGLETPARASYSEDIDMGSHEFVEMMIFDGCFIVELFFMQLSGTNTDDPDEDEEEEDPVLSTVWSMPVIQYDMLMLENQIPFFVISRIYDLVTVSKAYEGEYHSLNALTQTFFNDRLPEDKLVVPRSELVPKIHHLLHFFHSCIMPARCRKTTARVDDLLLAPAGSFQSAARLREAGIKFKEKKADSFLDVEFRDGVMEIPTLKVYDDTNSLFRNLIAFERCFPKAGSYFAAYTVLMDCLIDTVEDVALLHRHRCIVNRLGDDQDAADLFNRLRKEANFDYESCYLADLFRDVKKHTDSSWNQRRAKLMHDYFNSPWSVLSVIGALFLIFLTFIQSVLAVYAYLFPRYQ